jgi:hypothetical protein
MQHLAMVECFTHNRIAPPVTNPDLLRPLDQKIQEESHRTETEHFTDLGQVATLEGHYHKDVSIRIPARITPGQRPVAKGFSTGVQDHLLGGITLHHLPHHPSRGSRVLLCRYAEACGYVREQRKQDGRPGAPTEPFVCLGFATYDSHEGERPMAWGNLCGGWSGRSRRRGCQAVVLHTSCCLA